MSEISNKLNKVNVDTVMKAANLDQCLSALNSIDDEKLLVDIIGNSENQDVKIEAVNRISNEILLCKVTEKNCGKTAGIAAVEKITDPSLLKKISEKASNKKVRSYAIEKLESFQSEGGEPSVVELQEQKLISIYETAQKLADSWNWEYAANTLTEIRKTWNKLDPEREHTLCQSFDRLCEHFFNRYEQFQARHIEEEKQKLERDRKAKELELLCQEAEKLNENPNEVNTSRIEELRLCWQKVYVISGEVFESLEYRFNSACQKFEELSRRSREEKEKRNNALNELNKYCDEAELWSTNDDFRMAEKKLAVLSENWKKTIKEVKDSDDLPHRFEKALETFEVRKNEYEREQEKLNKETLEKLVNLCENVESLIKAEDRIEAERQVRHAQMEWKNLAHHTGLEHNTKIKLSHRFREAINQFYVQQRELRDQREWEQWANLTLKEEICSRLEGFTEEQDLFKVASTLKRTKQEWNDVGPIPREKSDDIWSRYKTICDLLYGRCKVFFDKLEQEQATNLMLKEEICLKIEAINSNSDQEKSIGVVRSLQSEWSEIGSVHRDQEEHINERFRKACDQYFDKRREYMKVLRHQKEEGLREKENICEKIETLIKSDDLYPKIDEVKALNEQWKKIGPVSAKKEITLWNRFRIGCDKFFNLLDEARPENLKKKQALIIDLEEALSKVKDKDTIEVSELNEIAREIMSIQKQWKSIGRVPEDNGQEVWEHFNKPCNEFFNLRRNVLAKKEEEYSQYLERKEKLFEELESLTDSTDLKEKSSEVKRIISEWQTIPTIPKARDQKLERRFRKVCDQFFDQKKAYVGKLKEERSIVSKKKEKLCVRMELLAGLKSSGKKAKTDSNLSLSEQLKLAFESNFIIGSSQSNEEDRSWNNSFEEARKIQKEWKKLGPPIRGGEDKIFAERFRKACDEFYSRRPKSNRSTKPSRSKTNH